MHGRMCCCSSRRKQTALIGIVILNVLSLVALLLFNMNPTWVTFYIDKGKRLPALGDETPQFIAKMMEERNFPEDVDVHIKEPQHAHHDPWSDSEGFVALPLRYGEMSQDEIDNAGWMEMTSKYSPNDKLNFTPPVPRFSINDVVWKLADHIMERNLVLDRRKFENYTVVILTPIHNSERDLVQYGELVSGLDYPKAKVSVVLGEDSSKDETLSMADHVLKALKKEGFRRTEVHHFNITGQVGGDWADRHRRVSQYKRRKHLAEARNLLLKAGLKDEDFVLWIDADIGYLPSDLIQQMIYTNKDVVTPCCLFRKGNSLKIYDKNTWKETKYSTEQQNKLPKHAVVVEGYGPTTRIFLPHLQGAGRMVPIDGVGGCSLLVKAKCHRKGLDFPEVPYRRHIETEGMAKKAKDMGYSVYGLPFLYVFHK